MPGFQKNPLRRASDFPLIGKHIGRIGRVIQITSNPCQITPEIWVYAAFTAVPTMFWTYVKPSPREYATSRILTHKRRKRKWSFEVGNMLPGLADPKTHAQWVIFRAAQFTQQIGWYFLVADVVTGGAVNWVSTAYRYAGCVVPGGSWAQLHILPDSVQLFGPGTVLINTWIVDGQQFLGAGPTGITVSGSQQASVGFGLTSKPNPFHIPDAEYSLRLVRDGQNLPFNSTTQFAGQNDTKINQSYFGNGMPINRKGGDNLLGGTYQVFCDKGPGAIVWASGHMSANTTPKSDGIGPDP